MPRPTVFISYSHKDKRWKDRLLTQLGVLQEQRLLDAWDDRRIGAGKEWLREIEEAMAGAKVAVFLVTANFLTSRFIQDKEVPAFLARREEAGTRVVPVLAEDCAWDQVPWLARLQMRPDGGKPLERLGRKTNSALAEIAREVLKITQEAPDPSDPFLEAYRQGMSALFSSWDLSTAWVAQAGGANAAPIHATLDDMYIPLRLAKGYDIQKTDEGAPLPPESLLAREHPLAICGPAGSGKTTWMRWTFRKLLAAELNALPLMLILRDLALRWQEQGCTGARRSLEAFLDDWVAQYLGGGWEGEVRRHLGAKDGPRPVLLVDGWDEVGPLSEELREKLRVLQKQYARLLVVVTSRPYVEGWPSHNEGFYFLDIQPLSDDNVQRLAECFFQRCYGEDQTAGRTEAERFVRALKRSPATQALARTALLLTMMLLISRSRLLSDKRHLLYEACIENLLTAIPDRRAEEGAILQRDQYRPSNSEERMRLVAKLAFQFQSEGYKRLPRSGSGRTWQEMAALLPEDWPERQRLGFLAWLAGPAGLLSDRADGTLVFTHLSFQEYLTAWHLNATVEGDKKRTQAFRERLDNPDWWETLRLWGALIQKPSPERLEPVLKALISQGEAALSLAGTMLADGLGDERSFQAWMSVFLDALIWGWPASWEPCTRAWSASGEEDRRAGLGQEVTRRAARQTWLGWLRLQEFSEAASTIPVLSPPLGRIAGATITCLDRETSNDAPRIAAGRILCGGPPLWPPKGLTGLLQVWPSHRRLAGLRLQLAISCGARRKDIGPLAAICLKQPTWDKAAHEWARSWARSRTQDWAHDWAHDWTRDWTRDLARHWALFWANDWAHDLARGWTHDWARDVAHDWARSWAHDLTRYWARDGARNWARLLARYWTRDWACELGLDSEPQWLREYASSDLFSFGRAGARAALARAHDQSVPEVEALATACRLSYTPAKSPSPLDKLLKRHRSTLHPLWPALARHIARVSTPEDRARLTSLAQYPEQADPPLPQELQWGLQFIVRGDVMLEDGSVVTLDELVDQVGLPHLPYLEDMPEELEVDWDEEDSSPRPGEDRPIA